MTVDIGATANPPGFDAQLAGLAGGGAEDVRREVSGRLRDQGAGGDDGQLRRDGQGDPEADRAGAGRRVREGPRRLRVAGRPQGARPGRPGARGEARSGSGAARGPDEAAGDAGHLRGAAGAAGAGDRPARRGVRAAADRSADRPDEDEHQLGGVPRAPARGGGGSGARRAGPGRGGAARGRGGVARDEIEAEIAKYAERTGRTPAAVRARLEKEGGIGRLYSGLRRERAIDFLLSRATIGQT